MPPEVPSPRPVCRRIDFSMTQRVHRESWEQRPLRVSQILMDLDLQPATRMDRRPASDGKPRRALLVRDPRGRMLRNRHIDWHERRSNAFCPAKLGRAGFECDEQSRAAAWRPPFWGVAGRQREPNWGVLRRLLKRSQATAASFPRHSIMAVPCRSLT